MPQDFSETETFSSADEAAWWDAVDKALKGAPRERLFARTDDSLEIAPLYKGRSDLPARGLRRARDGWTVVQRVDVTDIQGANAQILEDLIGGANGLDIILKNPASAAGHGLDLKTRADWSALFANVQADLITTRISGPGSLAALGPFLDYLQAAGTDISGTGIIVNFDPNGPTGGSRGQADMVPGGVDPLSAALQTSQALASPARLLTADGAAWHNQGASQAQELGLVLASAVSHLRSLEDLGLPLEEAVSRVSLSVAANADQFGTISKARAMRRLWASVLKTLKLEQHPVYLHMTTSRRMLTARDPWVNLLRNTVAAFAAGIGGADSICTVPHTHAVGLPDALARRLARNTQTILLEESNLARVIDPAAGSGAVEARTDQLCAAAWTYFQDIEGRGGLPAAIADGSVAGQIAQTRARLEKDIARRKRPITGVSEFPDLMEAEVTVLGDSCPVDVVWRYAAPFEALRAAADAFSALNGAPPKVFLASLGSMADFTARAGWTANTFAAGGFASEGPQVVSSTEELVAGFQASGAGIACLVSSDAVYAEQAETAAKGLKAAGARHLYMAGKPGAREADYLKAGVDTFLFAGCDILKLLQEAHRVVGLSDPARQDHQETAS